ncbi:hypothetical protein NBRGN_057_02910 [Nocardia brasiliensis NBRC 14402]|nr:hypothetical protein NBRGN_057_02910 [Nocardia brasiliensis NBRC 14402]
MAATTRSSNSVACWDGWRRGASTDGGGAIRDRGPYRQPAASIIVVNAAEQHTGNTFVITGKDPAADYPRAATVLAHNTFTLADDVGACSHDHTPAVEHLAGELGVYSGYPGAGAGEVGADQQSAVNCGARADALGLPADPGRIHQGTS